LVHQIDLLVFNHVIQVIIDMPSSHGVSDIFSVLWSDIVLHSLHDFRFDIGYEFQKRFLSPYPTKSAFFRVDGTLFDVLVDYMIVEFFRAFDSNIIWKFTTLWFDNVTFTRRSVESYWVYALIKSILNSLLVISSRILMLDQSLCRWLMFSIRSWLVVSIKNLVDSFSVEANIITVFP